MAAGYNSIVRTAEGVANGWAHHVVEVYMKKLRKKGNILIFNIDL